MSWPVGGRLRRRLGPVELALAGASKLRIFHSPGAAFPGPEVVATLGVDDIRAVPEPGVALLVGIGLALAQGGRLESRPTRSEPQASEVDALAAELLDRRVTPQGWL